MKKKKIFLNERFWLTLFIAGFFYLLSCNNNSPKTEQSASDTTKTAMDTTKKIARNSNCFEGDFPILSVPKTSLDAYFDPPPPKKLLHKIVFRFRFVDGMASPSLVMYGATSMSVFQPPSTPVGVVNPTTISVHINDSFYLGNLELSRKLYLDLKASAGTHPDLLFYPVLSSNYPHQVTYRLGWGNSSADSIGLYKLPPPLPPPPTSDELNPSPPAPPGS